MRDDAKLKQEVEASSLKWEAAHGGYVTLGDYFQDKLHDAEQIESADDLLKRVNALLAEYVSFGGILSKDLDTGTYISGSKGGAGDGGFRLSASITGRPGSAHKEAKAVDIFDAGDKLDEWITRDSLMKFGLFREAKQWTEGWCHLTTRPPKSLARSYNP